MSERERKWKKPRSKIVEETTRWKTERKNHFPPNCFTVISNIKLSHFPSTVQLRFRSCPALRLPFLLIFNVSLSFFWNFTWSGCTSCFFFFVDIFLIWSYVFHGNFNFFEQIHPPSRKVAITRIDCVWKCLKAIWKKAKKRIEKILKEWKSFEVLS